MTRGLLCVQMTRTVELYYAGRSDVQVLYVGVVAARARCVVPACMHAWQCALSLFVWACASHLVYTVYRVPGQPFYGHRAVCVCVCLWQFARVCSQLVKSNVMQIRADPAALPVELRYVARCACAFPE